MKVARKEKFNSRAFVSVITAFAFILVVLTGLMLFLTPPGRVANWTGWRLFGLTKDQLTSLHLCFTLSFLVGACFHIYFNWGTLVSYFKRNRKFALRGEWIATIGLCCLVFLASAVEIKPFSYLAKLRETIKYSWDKEALRGPVPHAELLTLAQIADLTGIDLNLLLKNLKAGGIDVYSNEVIVDDLAKAKGLTPLQFYNIAIGRTCKRTNSQGVLVQQKRGLGRKTLGQICQEEGIDQAMALSRLKDAGLQATPEMTLREISFSRGLNPIDILQIIKKEPR